MSRPSRIAMAFAAACLVSPAVALDFGVMLTDESVFSGSGSAAELSQENRAVAWLSAPIGASSSLYLSALYEFYGDFELSPGTSSSIKPYAFTAGRVEWEGFASTAAGARIGWSVGRIPFRDYSGRVAAGLFDGLKLDLATGPLQAGVSAAYTGLTFKEDANILIDADDEARWLDSGAGKALFAVPRLVVSAGARLAELVPLIDIGMEAWAQFDLDAEGDVDTDTQYFEPFVEGRFSRSVRWRLWGVAGLGQDPGFFYSMAGGGMLRYALPEALGLRVSGGATWAGGDYDGAGAMRAFAPITLGSLMTVAGTAFSDALALSLDASVAPAPGLSAAVGISAAFRPGAAAPYLGIEGSATLSYRPVNDFSASATGGLFIPGGEADPDAAAAWSVSASAAVWL